MAPYLVCVARSSPYVRHHVGAEGFTMFCRSAAARAERRRGEDGGRADSCVRPRETALQLTPPHLLPADPCYLVSRVPQPVVALSGGRERGCVTSTCAHRVLWECSRRPSMERTARAALKGGMWESRRRRPRTFATHAAGRSRDTEVERTCAGRERGVARQWRLLFITAGLWQ